VENVLSKEWAGYSTFFCLKAGRKTTIFPKKDPKKQKPTSSPKENVGLLQIEDKKYQASSVRQ
jgi:hypothetical protein